MVLLGAGCRETDPTPQPKNRAEATRLTKQGHSFAARTRPAWVDEPRGVVRPAPPAGWVQAGRGSWVLGQMAIQRTQPLADLAGDPQALEGKRVRLRAPVTPCAGEKSLVLLEDAGQRLVARLPGEIPRGIAGQRAVIEGELRRPSGDEAKAAGRCLQKDPPAIMLQASGVMVHLPSGGR